MEIDSSTAQVGRYPFPDDNLSPKDKALPKFGLQISRAIWMNNKFYGTNLFYNDRLNYEKYIKYALGKQSENDYKPFLGLKPDVNDKTWMKAINFQIKNYATKRVHIAISKILSQQFDVNVSSVDPLAIDAREDVRAKLDLYLEQKKWFDDLAKAVGVETSPDGVDKATIPLSRKDLDLFMELDYKTIEEIGMEMGIQHHLDRNKYNQDIRSNNAFSSFVLGVAAVYVGMDENVLPTLDWVDPAELIIPYSSTPNFTRSPYIARQYWVTVQEFRKMAFGYLDDAEIEDIIKHHSKKPNESITYTEDLLRYDDVNKIPLLHYNYRSTDTVVGVTREDDYGNKKFYRKDTDYYSTPKEAKRFQEKYGKSRKIHREQYNTVYEGFWVLNSKYVFRHGARSCSIRKRGNLSEDLMGFKIFAPTSFRGYIVSTGAQMIPMLDELQRYNLKIQQLVARAIPKGVGIDLYALRKANLKWDNKDLSDQQKIEMFVRSGIFVFDSKDRYAPGSNYKPFYEVENGLANDIEKYVRLIQQSLFELDEIIGLNKPSSASPDTVEGKGLNEIQIAQSDVALDFLYKVDRNITQEVVESLGVLHVQSVRYGPAGYYDRIFGKLKTVVFYSQVDFHKRDYGFNVKLQPKDKEWDLLYVQAEKAYDKGIIRYSDVLLLREMSSITQARRYLVMLENKYSREQQQNSMALQQQNADIQNQSIQAKLQADKELEQAKFEFELELEREKRLTLEMEYDFKADSQLRELRHISAADRQLTAVEGAEERSAIAAQGMEDRELERVRGDEKLKLEKAKPKPNVKKN